MKKNNDLLFLFFLFVAISWRDNLLAQSYINANDSAGIYLTYKDFEIGKLVNGFKPYQKNYTLWPKGFFKNKDVELKTPDTTTMHKRSDIWGYKDHKGRLIRVFNNKHYKILCDKGLIIYIIYSPVRSSYHFSKTLNDPIYRLSNNNLAVVFADNPDLLLRIISVKKKHWLVWDDKQESFLINELYSEI